MKINFTKKEYQTLVEMLLTADWVIRSHEEEPRAETKAYDDPRKKVLSHVKEMGIVIAGPPARGYSAQGVRSRAAGGSAAGGRRPGRRTHREECRTEQLGGRVVGETEQLLQGPQGGQIGRVPLSEQIALRPVGAWAGARLARLVYCA